MTSRMTATVTTVGMADVSHQKPVRMRRSSRLRGFRKNGSTLSGYDAKPASGHGIPQ